MRSATSLLVLGLILLTTDGHAASIREGSQAPPVHISTSSDRLTAHLEHARVRDVVAEIARQQGAEIHGAVDPNRVVTLGVDDVPLHIGLSRLLGSQSF